jgi:hypothetical protein
VVLHRQRGCAWRREERLDDHGTCPLCDHGREGAIELLRSPTTIGWIRTLATLGGGLDVLQERPCEWVGYVHQDGDVRHGR